MTNPKISDLFSRFIREKEILDRCAPKTIASYRDAWVAYLRYHGCTCEITEDTLKSFVIVASQSGVKPGAVNSFARALNSFCSWLYDNRHIPERLKVPLQPQARRVLHTYSPDDVRKITAHRPTSSTEKRLMAILFVLIDTGARIDEALSLTRSTIDWDNLMIVLRGKGNKERRVPIGLECRRHLSRWLNAHSFDLVFCTRDGSKLRYDNLRRDFLALLDTLKIPKSEGCFHAFRRYFGKSYLRGGGNPLYLQRVFGHTTLDMTKRYVEADDEDLQIAHRALSTLDQIKRSKR